MREIGFRINSRANIGLGGQTSSLFAIVFLAAAIGIVRPYKLISGSRRWHYGLAAFVALILVGVTAPVPDKSSRRSAQTNNESKLASAGQGNASGGPTPATEGVQDTSKWTYDETNDQMRGSTRRTAEVESNNSVDLDFPYGEQTAFITVRQDPQYGFDVMFRVRSGQILCNSFTDTYINVKFDGGPIRKFGCTNASDGTSDVAFITGARGFLASLRKANRTVIEAEFYQNGRVQYVFDTKDLKWE